MNINGRDIGFTYTIGVLCAMTDWMKEHPDATGVRVVLFTAVEMNKAYCAIHGGEPITEAELMTLPGGRFEELEKTVMAIQAADSETSVETEPSKEKGKKKAEEEKQS